MRREERWGGTASHQAGLDASAANHGLEDTHVEIRLPRFKAERSEDGRFALSKLSLPLIIGFGIHWTWVYLIMFSGKTAYVLNSADPVRTMSLFYVVALSFLVITLFAYAIASFPFRRLFASKRKRFINRLIGTALACSGTFLTCLADASTLVGTAIIGISGITAGIGSTVLLVSYGVSFGQCDLNTTLATTTLSMVIGIVFYAFVLELALLFPWAPFAIAVVIPVAECFFLWLNSSLLIDRLEFASITLKVHKPVFALRICLPNLLFGFALGIFRSESFSSILFFEDILTPPPHHSMRCRYQHHYLRLYRRSLVYTKAGSELPFETAGALYVSGVGMVLFLWSPELSAPRRGVFCKLHTF
jgi:hypothetical protein